MLAPNTKPSPPEPIEQTSFEVIDAAVEELFLNRQKWVNLPIEARIEIVEEIHEIFPNVWNRWVDLAVKAKGIAERKLGNDREWLELATISRIHSVVLRSLLEIKEYGRPRVPGGYRIRPNGQVAARVYPDSLVHSLAFRGITMDVWLKEGISMEEALSKQASAYNDSGRKGKVALVLGAGNASSLPSSDTFHKLFHDLCVVILKINPVNAYIGPLLEEAYRPLVDRGFLKIVYGGADVGNYLVNHKKVDEVHMTGSDKTFDTIVFGSGDEGSKRKKRKTPLVEKPVDGELGCITPWVIVPGDWKQADIKEQAAKMAFWMMRHEGYICFAPRLLIVHKEWSLRKAFLDALIEVLSEVEPIKAYYPGSAETQKIFVTAHPEANQIGGGKEDRVPWTVIPNLDPEATDDICFRRESFSGMCGEVALEAGSIPEFLERSVAFLNQVVWGTLSATFVISEKSLSNPAVAVAVERAIAQLKYGTVALNGPGTWGFYNMMSPWGGYPGSKIFDIQSGNAKVANFLMLYRPEKTVVRAPFRMRPYTFLNTAKDLDIFSRKLAEFEIKPSFWKLPGLFLSAIRT